MNNSFYIEQLKRLVRHIELFRQQYKYATGTGTVLALCVKILFPPKSVDVALLLADMSEPKRRRVLHYLNDKTLHEEYRDGLLLDLQYHFNLHTYKPTYIHLFKMSTLFLLEAKEYKTFSRNRRMVAELQGETQQGRQLDLIGKQGGWLQFERASYLDRMIEHIEEDIDHNQAIVADNTHNLLTARRNLKDCIKEYEGEFYALKMLVRHLQAMAPSEQHAKRWLKAYLKRWLEEHRELYELPEGCLVDGNRGIYQGEAIIRLAQQYGSPVKFVSAQGVHSEPQETEPDEEDYDFAVEEAVEYLEDFAPEGFIVCYEDGDFGVYADESER